MCCVPFSFSPSQTLGARQGLSDHLRADEGLERSGTSGV